LEFGIWNPEVAGEAAPYSCLIETQGFGTKSCS
jgi:hypothetical protein